MMKVWIWTTAMLRKMVERVDLSDVLVLVGLLALARGLALVASWAAYVVVGGVLIWYALPPRPPFIVRAEKQREGVR
jgi:hypothetical protein